MKAHVSSIQVGGIRDFVDPKGRAWQSAIAKKPVSGAVRVEATHVQGDVQADRVNHGGVDKAVLAYSAGHFDGWRREFDVLASLDSLNGAFGENLTVSGQVEADVCIGDVYRGGSVTLQVSQPRQPCWKLSRLWNLPTLAAVVQQTGRTGWYFRVLQTGTVRAGDELVLVERPHPEWTVARAHAVMHARPRVDEDDMELAGCDALSDAWREQLERRVRGAAGR